MQVSHMQASTSCDQLLPAQHGSRGRRLLSKVIASKRLLPSLICFINKSYDPNFSYNSFTVHFHLQPSSWCRRPCLHMRIACFKAMAVSPETSWLILNRKCSHGACQCSLTSFPHRVAQEPRDNKELPSQCGADSSSATADVLCVKPSHDRNKNQTGKTRLALKRTKAIAMHEHDLAHVLLQLTA